MPTARVYLIENHGKGYVGSTIFKIQHRLVKHRQSKKLYEQGKDHYMTSFELIDGNETIRLLEEFEYTTKKEMRIREQHYINTLPNLVNKFNSFGWKDRTDIHAEYRKTHRQQINNKQNEYREVHKEEANLYQREWRRRNKLFVEFLRDFNL